INSIDVKAEVSGQLVEVHVKEGQFVKQGDLLFTIDKRPFEAALDKALGSLEKNKSQLELAKIKLDRNKELVEKEFISKVTYDELKTQVASAEAQIKIDEGEIIQAQINLEHTMITAFTDGKIGQIN